MLRDYTAKSTLRKLQIKQNIIREAQNFAINPKSVRFMTLSDNLLIEQEEKLHQHANIHVLILLNTKLYTSSIEKRKIIRLII